MMKQRGSQRKFQTGALGVFVSVALVITLGLISLQNITATSQDLYLSNARQDIEEARQLAYAGLRHFTHTYGNDLAIQALIDAHRGNTDIIGECSYTVALPKTLTPKVVLNRPDTPNSSTQQIIVKGIVVPWNCDRSLSEENYRATFEIVSSVNCVGKDGVGSGCVKRSFVFNREDSNGLPYLPIRTPPPPPPPPNPNPPPRNPNPPPRVNPGPPSPPPPPPPKSIGKHEVGF